MTTVQVTLPDELAAEAKEAGLLSDERVEALLREQLKQQRLAGFFEAVGRIHGAVEEIGLTPEDLAEEIRAVRAEKRKSAA